MKLYRRLASVCLLLAVLGAGGVGRTQAHANLLRAEPAPNAALATAPSEIVLVFSEAVAAQGSRIRVLDADGQPATSTSVEVGPEADTMRIPLPSLPLGIYTVAWRALSTVDGHPTDGFYAFTVGEVDNATAPAAAGPAPGTFGEARLLDVAARVLLLVGGALVTGGLLGALFLWPALLPLPQPAEADDARLRRLLRMGLLLWGSGALLALLHHLALAGTAAALLGSQVGRLMTLRVLGLAGLAGLVGRAHLTPRQAGTALALSGAVHATATALSHSAALTGGNGAALLSGWLHGVAASVWIGGIAYLLVVPLPTLRTLPAEQRSAWGGALLRRFSPLALASFLVLAATGLFSSALHVGSVPAFRATAYGQTLGVKLLLLPLMLALGAVNLLVWQRRARAVRPFTQGLTRTVGAEAAVGMGILAAAALLTGLGPARSAWEARQAGTLTLRAPAPPLVASVYLTPPRPGPATLEVALTENGQPYDAAQRVRLHFGVANTGLGEAEAVAEPVGGGRYRATGSFFTIPGEWALTLQVQRRDGYDAQTTFVLLADDTIRPATPPDNGWLLLPPLIALIAAGLGLLPLARREARHAEGRGGSVLILAASSLLLFTAALLLLAPAT